MLSPSRPRLTSANQKAIARTKDPAGMDKRNHFSQEQSKQRQTSIDRWYTEGGEWFVKWVKEYYRTWSGEPLHWHEPFQEEFYLLFGNPWIVDIFVEKAAQIGYSEATIALTAFCAAEISIPVGFGLEAMLKRDRMVGSRVQTAFNYIEPVRRASSHYQKVTRKEDINSKSQITVGGVELSFFYVSSGAKSKNGQTRQASSSLSSFTCYVLLADEVELWPDGAIDIAQKRQQASPLPTKPFRAGSTPGHEGGTLDNQIKLCKHLLQWEVTCPHCNTVQFLDGFGNLLRPMDIEEDGIIETRYLDLVGRPLDWFCRDRSTPQASTSTAYIGCQSCAQELTFENISSGRFVCRHTGKSLQQICNETLRDRTPIIDGVAVRLPRLASRLFNPTETIRKLLRSRNPADEIQQGLGKSVSLGTGKISLHRIMRCVGLPLPNSIGTPDLVVVGADQGRAANIAVVQYWWLGTDSDPEQQWLNARKQTVWYGEVSGFDGVEKLAKQYDADLIGVDLKPEVQLAAAYGRSHLPGKGNKGQVLLFDQVALKGEDFKRAKRNIQGEEVGVYAIHRTFGLDAVRNRIYRQMHHLPPGLSYDPGDPGNLLLHYLSSERTLTGLWVEPQGVPDHLFHADCFCEMAVLCHFFEPKPKEFAFGGITWY